MSHAQQLEPVEDSSLADTSYSVIITPTDRPVVYPYAFVKRGMDIVIAGAALVVLAPLFLFLCLAVRSDGGDAFYGHTRIGFGGRRFKCLKFRSMIPNAGAVLQQILAEDPAAAREWAATQKLTNDPRVTQIGRFLRSSSLDEIPQIINVLRGDMSLIGPRPVICEELERHYAGRDKAYLSVRPGITGLWQVSGRSDTSYEERVALDCRYVQELSLGNDLRILLRTFPAVLKRSGAR